MPKLRLIQRLTNEMFKLNKKAKRDPRTKEEYLVRIRLHKIENIIRKRYGDIYYLTTKNVGGMVVDEKGEEYDMFHETYHTLLLSHLRPCHLHFL